MNRLLLGLGALVAFSALSTSSAAVPLRHAGTTTIQVTLGTPKELSVKLSRSSNIPAGTVVFAVTNRGKLQHVFVLCSSPVSGLANSCPGRSVTLTKTGQSARLTVTLKKGKYEYLSIVRGQTAAGTKGAVGIGLAVPGATAPVPATGTTTGSTTGTGSSGTGSSGSGGGTGAGSGFPVFPPGNAKNGALVFQTAGCATCHTLAAANATGTGGPDLDGVAPSVSDVESQVFNGGGPMPPFAGQLTTQEIADVAAYVAAST